jgi:NAD(P)-dependent dehydrogenase (short-subunit alcohol dehydrogenase family)
MAKKRELEGKVTVVAGATRGTGRGIARMLGEAGATVYCTGRSRRGQPWNEGPYAGRPESIDETAELVSASGGVGIAMRVDHNVESEVEALFERVAQAEGRLDVLVNVLGGNAVASWGPFWKLPAAQGRVFYESWVWKHVLTARYAAPLMVAQKSGLLVEVTEGDSLSYNPNLYWDLVKISLARLVFVMAEELAPHGVSALAITPGYLRSEYMLEHFGVTEENWREAGKRDQNVLHSETPCFVGRAVVALATDPAVRSRSGALLSSWGLAEEYGFTDLDGTRPNLGRHLAETGQALGSSHLPLQWELTQAHA